MAAAAAACARGDMPQALSLAPTRARKRRPVVRSRASGPTKGLAASRRATSLVNGGTLRAAASREPA